MKRLNWDILGISEVRWTEAGRIYDEENVFLYSGGLDNNNNGVGILVRKKTGRCLNGFWPIPDRVVLARFSAKPFDVAVIQVCAPTAVCEEHILEEFLPRCA